MNEFIEDTAENQIANGQSNRDLRVSSEATELEQFDVVNAVEQCPDVEREWERQGGHLLPEQIDADERLPGYLREPHLPRFKSRRTRKFTKHGNRADSGGRPRIDH